MSDWLSIVAAINDNDIYHRNLARSPALTTELIPITEQRGFASAACAYNEALQQAKTPWIAFVHQDVYLPSAWTTQLRLAIQQYEAQHSKLGVLGVFGIDINGDFHGTVWSSGIGKELNFSVPAPVSVVSLDELVLVVRLDCELLFDAELPGFHLYGTDIALSALERGLDVCVFDGPVIHNSRPVLQLDESYEAAYRRVAQRWAHKLPVPTCIVTVENNGAALKRWRRQRSRRTLRSTLFLRNRRFNNTSLIDPVELAQRLGYEPPPTKIEATT